MKIAYKTAAIGVSVFWAIALAATPALAVPIIVVDSPFSPGGGDGLVRGFYVEDYGADNIDTVTLQYQRISGDTGTFELQLTVRLDTYEGTIVGQSSIMSSLTGGVPMLVTYDFGAASVGLGSLLTFTQEVLSNPGGGLVYDVGIAAHPQITQTEGTTPPLDTFRRDRVGVLITADVADVPEPTSLLLLGIGLAGLGFARRRLH